jgi:putative flippase GtrA
VDDGVVPAARLTLGARATMVASTSSASPRKSALLGEVLRFCGVGAFSYLLGIALAALFHEISGLRPEVAVGLSLAAILLTNFFLARVFIFRSSGRVHHELVLFGITSAAMRGAEYLVFLALLNGLAVNYLVAMTIAMLLSSCVKFLLYRNVVFRKRAMRG